MVLAHKDHLPKEARFTAVMESAVIMTSCPNIHVVKLLDVGAANHADEQHTVREWVLCRKRYIIMAILC